MIAEKLKHFRKAKGLTQEGLAETAGLSLRTIQRIEAKETEPRGDTLRRLAVGLDVSVDDLADNSIEENKEFLSWLNLSALTSWLFPLLGVLVPLILWLPKKARVRNAKILGVCLLNFQLTWVIVLFAGYFLIIGFVFRSISSAGDISPGLLVPSIRYLVLFTGIMYGYSLFQVLRNSRNIRFERPFTYGPSLPLIRP